MSDICSATSDTNETTACDGPLTSSGSVVACGPVAEVAACDGPVAACDGLVDAFNGSAAAGADSTCNGHVKHEKDTPPSPEIPSPSQLAAIVEEVGDQEMISDITPQPSAAVATTLGSGEDKSPKKPVRTRVDAVVKVEAPGQRRVSLARLHRGDTVKKPQTLDELLGSEAGDGVKTQVLVEQEGTSEVESDQKTELPEKHAETQQELFVEKAKEYKTRGPGEKRDQKPEEKKPEVKEAATQFEEIKSEEGPLAWDKGSSSRKKSSRKSGSGSSRRKKQSRRSYKKKSQTPDPPSRDVPDVPPEVPAKPGRPAKPTKPVIEEPLYATVNVGERTATLVDLELDVEEDEPPPLPPPCQDSSSDSESHQCKDEVEEGNGSCANDFVLYQYTRNNNVAPMIRTEAPRITGGEVRDAVFELNDFFGLPLLATKLALSSQSSNNAVSPTRSTLPPPSRTPPRSPCLSPPRSPSLSRAQPPEMPTKRRHHSVQRVPGTCPPPPLPTKKRLSEQNNYEEIWVDLKGPAVGAGGDMTRSAPTLPAPFGSDPKAVEKLRIVKQKFGDDLRTRSRDELDNKSGLRAVSMYSPTTRNNNVAPLIRTEAPRITGGEVRDAVFELNDFFGLPLLATQLALSSQSLNNAPPPTRSTLPPPSRTPPRSPCLSPPRSPSLSRAQPPEMPTKRRHHSVQRVPGTCPPPPLPTKKRLSEQRDYEEIWVDLKVPVGGGGDMTRTPTLPAPFGSDPEAVEKLKILKQKFADFNAVFVLVVVSNQCLFQLDFVSSAAHSIHTNVKGGLEHNKFIQRDDLRARSRDELDNKSGKAV
eukprot:sb/3462161/